MDKNELKQKIIEVAEIVELKPVKVRGIRLDETNHNNVKIDNEWVDLNEQANPTLGFKFVKLKDQNRACELGCGAIIANQIIEKRLAFTPEKHWRTRCQQCGKYVAPDGQSLLEGGHLVAATFLKYFKGKK